MSTRIISTESLLSTKLKCCHPRGNQVGNGKTRIPTKLFNIPSIDTNKVSSLKNGEKTRLNLTSIQAGVRVMQSKKIKGTLEDWSLVKKESGFDKDLEAYMPHHAIEWKD